MNDVISIVRDSLLTDNAEEGRSTKPGIGNSSIREDHEAKLLSAAKSSNGHNTAMDQDFEEQGWEEDAEHEMFMDMGEGAGIEGDLEMDDD